MDNRYDFSGWATRANMKCSDGRTIMKDAFLEDDGRTVPLVWQHTYTTPDNVLGHALLENREDGVYAYCSFNDTPTGQYARELVKHGDITALSIAAHKLKQRGGDVLHGVIKELSLVMAGANPGAYIETVMCHDATSEEEAIIYTGEDIELAHAEDETKNEEEVIEHADNKKEDKEDNTEMAETKEKVEEAKKPETEESKNEKTVGEVFDEFTPEQKEVVYALIGQAIEDAKKSNDDEDDEEDVEDVEHSEGGNETMYTNVFEQGSAKQATVLTHADQEQILKMAKQPGCGSLKMAMMQYVEENKDTLTHAFNITNDSDPVDVIGTLFPDYKDVRPGAPELLERDMGWVGQVLKKAHKSPVSRVRTRQVDARAADIKAKGYSKRNSAKTVAANLKVLMRTTDPQTIYFRDSLHRDDIIDINDFDVVAYQKNIMKHNLEEKIALAALVGDGLADTDTDKISEDHIRSVWHDSELYTIRANVDVAAAKATLQGTDTGVHFGDNYVFAEAFITSALYAREHYKGKGELDFYCAPHTLNMMLLARDLNGRRLYDSAADLAKVLNVANIYTVEQMEGLTREDDESNEHKLLGIFVNMAHYQFGCAKGGEITSFEQFDIDFNNYKYLMETRLSGALVDPYSAIVMEQKVTKVTG